MPWFEVGDDALDLDDGFTSIRVADQLDGLVIDTECAVEVGVPPERRDYETTLEWVMTPEQMRELASTLVAMARFQERNGA